MELSRHQLKHCDMCADDASKYNHCAWCGETFKTPKGLFDHLCETDCTKNIERAMGF